MNPVLLVKDHLHKIQTLPMNEVKQSTKKPPEQIMLFNLHTMILFYVPLVLSICIFLTWRTTCSHATSESTKSRMINITKNYFHIQLVLFCLLSATIVDMLAMWSVFWKRKKKETMMCMNFGRFCLAWFTFWLLLNTY